MLPQLERMDMLFRDDFPSGGMAQAVDQIRVARNQMMPIGKLSAAAEKAVGTSIGQPVKLLHTRRSQYHTGGNPDVTIVVGCTPAGGRREEVTTHIGIGHFTGFIILEFLYAAFPTTIAQQFPFCWRHFPEAFGFPEGFALASSAAILPRYLSC